MARDISLTHDADFFDFDPYEGCETGGLALKAQMTRTWRVRFEICSLRLFSAVKQGSPFPERQNRSELKFGRKFPKRRVIHRETSFLGKRMAPGRGAGSIFEQGDG